MSGTREIDPQDVVLDFGKHVGKHLTEVPHGYVRWMANERDLGSRAPPWNALAKAEYERRGLTLPTLELSMHAVNNASLRVRKRWHQTALSPEEGLYSWLRRVTAEAIERGERGPEGRIHYLNMTFVMEQGNEFPVLKTITPQRGASYRLAE